MHDDVGPELERPLQVRGGERVVDHQPGAVPVRDRADGGDVDDREQRVRRGLDPDQPGLVAPGGVDRGRIGEVDGAPLDAGAGEHLGDEAVGAAVGVVGDHDVVARSQEPEHGVLGRHARREREAARRAFERRDAHLERAAGGVAGA